MIEPRIFASVVRVSLLDPRANHLKPTAVHTVGGRVEEMRDGGWSAGDRDADDKGAGSPPTHGWRIEGDATLELAGPSKPANASRKARPTSS